MDSGYEVPDLEVTDLKLKSIGVTDGYQLNVVAPQKMGLLLGAPSALYGQWLKAPAGQNYQADFWLVDTKTGAKLWEESIDKPAPNMERLVKQIIKSLNKAKKTTRRDQ